MLMPYPMKLTPALKTALWGGRQLSRKWHKGTEGESIAESWELTVRDRENNLIANGSCVGRTLQEVLSEHPAWIGEQHKGDRFPLLIKFIDAEQTLSVQVHPDDDYAARVECDSGKNEMWYIVDAAPGAEIVYGLREGVSAADFRQAVVENRICDVLRFQPVCAGECYYIPAGLVHAIGGGILIAEIQQNSDLTYRVYDYDRRDANGNLRELHQEKACDVVYPMGEADILAKRYACRGEGEDCLAHSVYFSVRQRHSVEGQDVFDCVGADSFVHLLCLDGACVVRTAHGEISMSRGESVFLPATLGEYTVNGCAAWLESRL